MTELTHDTAEDGFHEIQLSGKQLVALFIVTTTVIVIVFLCGVRVGRGARDAQLDEPEQIAATTPAPQPAATSGPHAAEPPAPAAETPEQLSYPQRLSGDGTAAETLKKPEDTKKPQPREPKEAEETKPQPAPAATAPPPPAQAPAPKTAGPAASADNLPTAGHSGVWAVQVIATRDRDVASSVVKRLVGKGYPAFLVNPPAGASPAYFKVHVGRFADRGEAEKVSTRIKKEEQFQSWITR